MNSLRSPWALLVLGVTLLLGSPLIAMIPQFTPPNSCPPCMNFPEITYPFVPVGVSLSFIGLILAIFRYVKLQRVAHKPLRTFGPLISIALVLVLAGLFLMILFVSGTGWSIGLYQMEGFYLFALGVAVALCAILSLWANWRSAIMLSVGTIIAGFSLLLFHLEYTDLGPRCNVEVGCSALLARSVVLDFVMLGLLLALATFLMGYGIASFRKR